MKSNDYLFAVASVRAMENALLKKSDLEQLINAEDYGRAAALLAEKGYALSDGADYSAVLDAALAEVWRYITEAAPEASALRLFIIKNDFQNLKAALKAEIIGTDAEGYFVQPTVFNSKQILQAVRERKFETLPSVMAASAQKAFSVLCEAGSGQLCDAIIDKACLDAMLLLSAEGGDAVLSEYAQAYCLAADIKTAYRSAKTKKNLVFLNYALAETSLVDVKAMAVAAAEGTDALAEYISNAGLTDYRNALEQSGSAFEKYCDDKMLEIIKKAKMTAFGISPLAAYYVAKETEIKCLRIILSAKQSRVSSEIIRERMRELYV